MRQSSTTTAMGFAPIGVRSMQSQRSVKTSSSPTTILWLTWTSKGSLTTQIMGNCSSRCGRWVFGTKAAQHHFGYVKSRSGRNRFPGKRHPQGGIISPLLSNIVLNELDWWIASQWEEFPTHRKYLEIHLGNPMHKRRITSNYTSEGREAIHTALGKNINAGIMHYLMRTPIPCRSAAYNDNRISLYCAQCW